MVSLFNSVLERSSVQEMARAWNVTPVQAARRLRKVPFVVLDHANSRGGGRGRPARRLALDPGWRFPNRAGGRPLTELVAHLRVLHELGEPFALGVPFTSAYWRPFLHPEVRLFAPPETFSLWQRLYSGASGTLRVTVGLLPDSAPVVEREGLPVLDPSFASVDAVLGFQRTRNLNVLALADWLAHERPVSEAAMSFAAGHGVDHDVRYLEDHRRRLGARVVRPEEVREAHRRAREEAQVPAAAEFRELLAREAMASD